MKKFDYMRMTGCTAEDEAAINRALEDEFELFVDEFNRVLAGELYIADIEIAEEA